MGTISSVFAVIPEAKSMVNDLSTLVPVPPIAKRYNFAIIII